MTTKTPFLFSIFLLIAFIGFQSFKSFNTGSYHKVEPFRSGGFAAVSGEDGTGGPYTTEECDGCHGGGSYNPTIEINLIDSGMNITSSYIPGDTYTVQMVIAATSGSPAGYGAQGLALNTSNLQAGTFNSAITPNSQITNLSGRQYIEHDGRNAAGIFEYEWVAPAIGTGDVIIYASGLAVNGSGTGGDSYTFANTKNLTENALSIADFNFKNNVKLFPNPSSGDITIKFATYYEKVDLKVTNIIGQTLITKTDFNTDFISFSMENKPGLYFASLQNDQGSRATIRFIVM